jgi:hypothetical protein
MGESKTKEFANVHRGVGWTEEGGQEMSEESHSEDSGGGGGGSKTRFQRLKEQEIEKERGREREREREREKEGLAGQLLYVKKELEKSRIELEDVQESVLQMVQEIDDLNDDKEGLEIELEAIRVEHEVKFTEFITEFWLQQMS